MRGKMKTFILSITFFLLSGVCLALSQPEDGLTDVITNYQPGGVLVEKLLNAPAGSANSIPVSSFSFANLIGSIIFSGIGFAAFVYGKKQGSIKPLIIGVILMGYPYFLPGTLAIYGVGIGLCGLLFFWRN